MLSDEVADQVLLPDAILRDFYFLKCVNFQILFCFFEDVSKSSQILILIQSNFTGWIREGSRQQRSEQNVIIKQHSGSDSVIQFQQEGSEKSA